MDAVLQYGINGLATGVGIALLSFGVVLVYRSAGVVNFAQGAMGTFSAFVLYSLWTERQWPLALAVVVTLAVSAALGVVLEAVAVWPLRNASPIVRTTSTVGLSLVLTAAAGAIWSYEEYFLPLFSTQVFTFGDVATDAHRILIIVGGLAVAAGVLLFLRRTRSGLALTALADHPSAARLLGVNERLASRLVWSLGGTLAGVAGILVTPVTALNTYQLSLFMISALAAALVGGFSSLGLALAGGVLMGITQAAVTASTSITGLVEISGFAAVFVVLVFMRRNASVLDTLASEKGVGL